MTVPTPPPNAPRWRRNLLIGACFGLFGIAVALLITPVTQRPWQRLVLTGAAALGLIGAVGGLIVGLYSYPPTAWFAAVELGFPGAVAGAWLGSIVALTDAGVRHLGRRRSNRRPPSD